MDYLLQKLGEFQERLKNQRFSGPCVPSSVLDLISGDCSRYFELDVGRRLTKGWFEPANLSTPAAEKGWEQHKKLHPVLSHAIAEGDGSAGAISQHWSQRFYRDTPLYRDYYRLIRIEDALGCAVQIRPYFVIGVGVGRGRWGFTDTERVLLNVLRECMHFGWLATNLDVARSREIEFLRAEPELWLFTLRTLSESVDTRDIETLTARELEVLSWMTEGKSNREIATILSRDGTTPTEATVKTHVRRIIDKLHVENRINAGSALRDVIDQLLRADLAVTKRRMQLERLIARGLAQSRMRSRRASRGSDNVDSLYHRLLKP